MQGTLVTIVLLWVSAALQGAWPAWLRLGGQPPDLVVAVVVCVGLLRGAVAGCVAGLVGAVLLAGAGHIPLGGLLTGLLLAGAMAGFLRGSLFSERLSVAILVAAVGVLVAHTVRLIFVPPPSLTAWLWDTLYAALFTALCTPVVAWAARFTRTSDRTP